MLTESKLLGSSARMQATRERVANFAPVDWHVRIEGATGTGKNLAARELHRLSLRRAGPFIECNVNALPDGMEVPELFGHTRGAFTGAVSDAPGLVEAAHGGTLFIDEVATSSPATQRGLLQVVDELRVRRVGECRSRTVDVRIVFATNADLEAAVRAGAFRHDLYQRMGLLVVRMPSLAEMREDIPYYMKWALDAKAREAGRTVPRLSRESWARLAAFDWPGNMRQLQEVAKYIVLLGELPEVVRRPGRDPAEWQHELGDVLLRNGGSVSATARELGVSRKAVYRGMRRQ